MKPNTTTVWEKSIRGKIPCSTSWFADRLTRSLTFSAAMIIKINWLFHKRWLNWHSLFLSIADCKGLESTIAFGGDTRGSLCSIALVLVDGPATVIKFVISHTALSNLHSSSFLPSDILSIRVFVNEQLFDLRFKGENQLGNFFLIVCKMSWSNFMFQMRQWAVSVGKVEVNSSN